MMCGCNKYKIKYLEICYDKIRNQKLDVFMKNRTNQFYFWFDYQFNIIYTLLCIL